MVSFRARLVLLFAGLAGGALAISMVAVSLATSSQSERTVERELEVSQRVFIEVINARGAQLLQAAEVLINDFAFREAVATRDQATIISALINHGERIGTDLMVLQSPNGEEIAATHEPSSLPALAQLTQRLGTSTLVNVDGQMFQLVTVAVRSPDLSAWATLGFQLDDALATSLRRLTGAEVSFVVTSTGRVLASSLAPADQDWLQQAMLLPSEPYQRALQQRDWANRTLPLRQTELVPAGDSEVNILFSIDYAEATAEFALLRQQYIGIAIATLLMALVFASVAARRINQPVARLTNAAERLRKGDYNEPVAVTGDYEFVQLAETFDAMRSAVSEREKHIVYQVEHDLLTGLPNRTSLQKLIRSLLERQQPATFVILNIVRFREINDRLGQRIGDQLLKLVAQRLKSFQADDNSIARLAGDEFVLVLRGQRRAEREVLIDRLQEEFQHPYSIDKSRYPLQCRLGIVQLPEHGDNFDTLVRRAQMCSSAAKLQQLSVVEYEPGMDEQHMRRLRILQALPNAVTEQNLQLHYQPKIAAADGRVIGAEALLRWRDDSIGVVRPDEFIPLAEQTGEITPITAWVIQAALDQLQLWQEQGFDFVMAINLSAVNLQEPELVESIQQQLKRRHIDPSKVTFEVTESALMVEPELAIAKLAELRALGVKISIDDYGTGYSSLAQLKRLPVDELKIDRSFVQDLAISDIDLTIVASTLRLARDMGLTTVAEGVEDEQAWQLLRDKNCDVLQGFYFSRPLAAAQFDKWLKEYLRAHK